MIPTSPARDPSAAAASLPPINDGRRHSRLDLARRITGELPDDDADLAEGTRWRESLEGARTRVEPFDFEVLRARAARLTPGASLPSRRVTASFWRWLSGGLTLAAMAVTLAVVGPTAPTDGPDSGAGSEGLKGGPSTHPPSPFEVRGPEQPPSNRLTSPEMGVMAVAPDGPGELSFVVQRDGKRVRGGRHATLQDGDLIAFRCYAAGFEEVTLASIAADGSVSPVDPTRGFNPLPLDRFQRVDIEGYEKVTLPVEPLVVAFFGPWTEAQIRALVNAAWATGGSEAIVEVADSADNIDAIQLR